MFSHVLATLAGLALAAAPAFARPVDGDEVTLKAGDKAPALAIESWIKGSPVAAFEPGKMYVVEFWATWCGPCVKGMPHLSEVQKHYREKGLTVIGVTSGDPRNSLEDVQAMVEEKGDAMAYTVAWDKERETHSAYMKAAQQRGIPCCFLVDGSGNIAYIGHPMWLDLVLEGVFAGTWEVEKGKEAVAKAEGELMAAFQLVGSDPAKALELFEAFLASHPYMAPQFKGEKFALLLAAGRLDDGYALARELVAEAMKAKDANMLLAIAGQIVDPEQELARRDLELALKAAKFANELTKGEDPRSLTTLARVHSMRGEHESAIALQEKAIELAEDPRLKEYLEGVLEELRKAAGE